MSNQNRPRLGLPGNMPPPPPVAPPPAPTPEVLAKFPLPWVVGPYGDVWVAEDVEQIDGNTSTIERIIGLNGTHWRSKVAKPRLVFDAEKLDREVTAFIVETMNATAKR